MTINNKFLNFDVKSYYSLLKSTISIDNLIQWNISNNNSLILLVDDSMSSCIEFYTKCIKNNLKPVIGLNINYKNNKLILIARNNNGYHKLLKISSYDKLNQDYNLNEFLNNQDLIIILKDGNLLFNDKYFFKYNELAINKVRYLNKEDYQSYCALCAIKYEKKLIDINYDEDYCLLTYEDAINIFNKELIQKTYDLINDCEWSIKFNEYEETNKIHFPKFNTNNIPSNEYLTNLCLLGLKKKFNNNQINKKYIDRLMYELSIIKKMNLDDYFLVVQDFINYAKNNDILIGPGRGSAAGSLVCYALNITEVDPIENNLIFERFLNVDRKNLPDIDIDVMDSKRENVINYIFEKYGNKNVSFIATYQRIKMKMAIRDVGRILDIDLKTIDQITKLIVDDYTFDLNNEDLKYYYDNHQSLFEIAQSLIDIPRNVSTHAAGLILCDQDVTNFYAVQSGIDNLTLSQLSMEYIEQLDLVKIDILGLKNLSIIQTILEKIYNNYQQKINLNLIDKNDKNLFNEISNGNTIGIFQLESLGMRNTLKKIKPKSIEDISITSAFFRPGPQAFIDDYVKTKNGTLKPNYLSENLKPFLEPTLGFIIYQEQVMEVIKNIAGFSMAKADIFRRAISKKKVELFSKMEDEFINCGVNNGYNKDLVVEIYNHLLNFAKYGFNHSHSLSYAYLSYQMMFLKYYYPLEFCLTLLMYMSSSNDKNILYINEAKRYQIKILNVDILKSQIYFDSYDNKIIFGFINVKGIGYETAKKIVEVRNNNINENIINLIKQLSFNKVDQKSIESLIKVGAFDSFNIDRLSLLNNLDTIIKSFLDNQETIKLIEKLKLNNLLMSEEDKFKYEKELLGYTFSNNQYEKTFNEYCNKFNLTKFEFNSIDANKNYLVYIISCKKILTKYKRYVYLINILINDNNYELFVNCSSDNENIYLVGNWLSVKLKNNNYKLSIVKVNEIIKSN